MRRNVLKKKQEEGAKKKTAKKKKKNTGSVSSRKGKKGSEKNYTAEDLEAALNAMGEGQTLRQAAYSFGLPKSTLFLKSKGVLPLVCRKGPKTVLSEEIERDIASWIVFSAESGFPVTKSRLLDSVEKYTKHNKIETPFKNNRPGPRWYHSFMHRHPHLSTRIAQNLTSMRAAVTEENLRNWFAKIKKYLEEKGLLHIPAHRVFNLDESAFMLVPKDNKVITEKGTKAPYQIVSSNEKASITVLFTTSAIGVMPPPMILFDLKTTPKKNVLDKIPKGWGVGNTDRGWMTAESFYSYIKNVFYKWLQENNYVLPIILYVDGHSSHMTLSLLQFCKEHLIELIVLYPNATHIIQPLDVAVFHPFKNSYRDVLRKWRIDNDVVDVKKYMFAPILKVALDSHDLTEAIKNGFRTCGLYPLNADAVNYNILKKKSKKKESSDSSSTSSPVQSIVNKHVELKAIFEKNLISPDILQMFKEAESDHIWHGDVEYSALFESWRKLQKLCGTAVDTCNVSSATDHSHSDDSIPDALGCSEIQMDLSNILDTVDDNAVDCYGGKSIIDQSIEIDFQVPSSEIEIYDEIGNRITATVITVISDDTTMENDSIYTSAPECIKSSNKDEIQKEATVSANTTTSDETSKSNLNFGTSGLQEKNPFTAAENTTPSHETSISSPDFGSSVTQENSATVAEKATTLVETSISSPDFGSSVTQENSATVAEKATTLIETSISPDFETSGLHENNYATAAENTITSDESSAKSNSDSTISSVLRENNSANHMKIDNSHLCINEESNSSACSTENKADGHTPTSKLKEFFSVPTFTPKNKKKNSAAKTPSVSVVDDLLEVLQQKEIEKKEKEQQIMLNKQEREKARAIKEKESSIVKQYNETKKTKLQKKKEVKKEIQLLKKTIKSEISKENVVPLTERLNNVSAELKELENSMIKDEVAFLQTKMIIKQEIV